MVKKDWKTTLLPLGNRNSVVFQSFFTTTFLQHDSLLVCSSLLVSVLFIGPSLLVSVLFTGPSLLVSVLFTGPSLLVVKFNRKFFTSSIN